MRATPSAHRWASRVHWCGSSGASVAQTTMIDPRAGCASSGTGTTSGPISAPDRHAVDAQPIAPAVVGLHEHADGVAAVLRAATRDDVPIPPLKPWQIIPVPPPTSPSSTAPPLARVQCLVDVLGPHVEAVDVVEQPVPRLPDDRQGHQVSPLPPRATSAAISASRTTPTECVFVSATGVVSVPGLAHPLEAGQLAVAVEPVTAGEVRLEEPLRVGDQDRHTRADRPVAAAQRAVALDERDRADLHPGYVGDRVARPGRQRADVDPEVASARYAVSIVGPAATVSSST